MYIVFTIVIIAQPLIIAHRGAMAYAPENTIASFRIALELGANALELDLRQTKDGRLIVIHDASVNRTTNGKGNVDDYSFETIRDLDAGSWFDKKFNFERIPELQEVINMLSDSVFIIKELKEGNETYNKIEEKVVSLIRQNKIERQTILKSFDPNVLKRLRKIAPDIPLCYVYTFRIPWLGMIIDRGISFKSIWNIDVEYLQPHRFFLSRSFVKKAQFQGFKVIAWGVESESAILEALDFGVDGIETNYADKVKRILSIKKQ